MAFYGPVHPFWLFGMLICLAVPIAVIVAIVLATRPKPMQAGPGFAPPPPGPPPPGPPGPPGQTAREILDRRFAAGEIDADVYQRARDLLEGKPPPGS